MKFNEKLIELRKRAGLSQEELGYKLNVTRQTVSKWELGSTTPEMDKLAEMSKIFNVSVDELINDSETVSTNNTVIDDQPIKDKDVRGNNKGVSVAAIIIFIAVVVFLFFIIRMLLGVFVLNKFNDVAGEMVNGYSNTVSDMQDNFTQNAGNMIGDMMDGMMDGMMDVVENSGMGKSKFNGIFEINAGTGMGAKAIDVLDEIITSNKKEERKITVKYNETETQNEDEIKNIKQNIDEFGNYDVTFEYDEEGYINEAKIEKVISKMDISKFNSPFEIFAGTGMGAKAINVLDLISASNKKEERKIIVKYNETETQNEDEIKNIKQNIDQFGNYDVTFEYDEDGFINKAIIEKF